MKEVWGAFHLTKYSGLKFQVFYATNRTVISQFVRLTNPRPSGSKFCMKIRDQTRLFYLCLVALGLLNDSEVKINDVLGEGDNIPFIVRFLKESGTTFTVPFFFPDEFKSHFRLTSKLFTRFTRLCSYFT